MQQPSSPLQGKSAREGERSQKQCNTLLQYLHAVNAVACTRANLLYRTHAQRLILYYLCSILLLCTLRNLQTPVPVFPESRAPTVALPEINDGAFQQFQRV
ncbi:hypothetical protein LZ31DRAFT_327910 [Colletotrichum somersetense]|nr:hypothetical protein LZ31DRAFT_327910 [Colletotrichum somersetense]